MSDLEKVAKFIMEHGLATGHGETLDDLLIELGPQIERLRDVAAAARQFIREGVRLTPECLIVRESNNRSDPYYILCDALEAIAPLNP